MLRKQLLLAPAAVLAAWIIVRRLLIIFGSALLLFAYGGFEVSAAEDGKRGVDVPHYGVRTRVPQAWSLIDWGTGERAFELVLPQDKGSKVGFVRCTMSPAPESLEALEQKVNVSVDDPKTKPKVVRRLKADEIAPLASPAWPDDLVKRFGRRLTIEWECEDAEDRHWYERTVYVIGDGLLYAFALETDEAHYDSFALDFQEMLAALKIKTPDTKLQQLESGHWLQRELRFGLKLPEKWRPMFSDGGRALFFATGDAHGTFTDSLAVRASLLQPQNLEQLKLDIPERTKKIDPTAEVECRIIDERGVKILETLIRSKKQGVATTSLERRFQTRQRNYEVKLNCATEVFGKRESEFRAALDTFFELAPAERSSNAT